MAVSHYGVEATKTHNTTPPFKVEAKTRHARGRVSYDEYEAAGVVVGSQIALGWVPAGAKILGGELLWDALGSGTTLQVGDAFDCDRFMALAVTTGTAFGGDCGRFNVIGDVSSRHGTGIGYTYECDSLILVTVPYGGGTITGTLKLRVNYSTD